MHIHTVACGDVPCWVYSNENVTGQYVQCFLALGQTYLVEKEKTKPDPKLASNQNHSKCEQINHEICAYFVMFFHTAYLYSKNNFVILTVT